MPQTGTQTCTDRHAEQKLIAFSASSERMQKEAAAADDRVDQGSLWRKRRPLRDLQSSWPGRGHASDLLRGGLGGPGLGLDVLEDCAPSAALLLLVGHNFLDSEGLLATRGAHLPEAEHYMWAGGKWGCGTTG